MHLFIFAKFIVTHKLVLSGISPHVSQMSKVYMQVLILQHQVGVGVVGCGDGGRHVDAGWSTEP
jgi:hypothetical protein